MVMNQLTDRPGARPRIVIVGAGYAGYHCARHLERRLPRGAAEIVIVSPADYMPYTSLLPQVGAGTVDPRHIAVSLPGTLRRTRHVPGHAVGVDFTSRSLAVAGPDGQRREQAREHRGDCGAAAAAVPETAAAPPAPPRQAPGRRQAS